MTSVVGHMCPCGSLSWGGLCGCLFRWAQSVRLAALPLKGPLEVHTGTSIEVCWMGASHWGSWKEGNREIAVDECSSGGFLQSNRICEFWIAKWQEITSFCWVFAWCMETWPCKVASEIYLLDIIDKRLYSGPVDWRITWISYDLFVRMYRTY